MIRLIAWFALTPALALAQGPTCVRDGSQSQMNACASQDASAADQELNEVYQAVRGKFSDQPVFLERLRTAQDRWIAFRDAELEARFPARQEDDVRLLYGSMYPMCLLGEKERLTRERTTQLRKWLDGAEPGDGCAGSIPIRQD